MIVFENNDINVRNLMKLGAPLTILLKQHVGLDRKAKNLVSPGGVAPPPEASPGKSGKSCGFWISQTSAVRHLY